MLVSGRVYGRLTTAQAKKRPSTLRRRLRTQRPNVHNNTGIIRAGDDWLLADAIGSVQTVVDNTGATINTADYTVFGEQLNGNSGVFGFAGQQLDPTGLHHLRARDYNPTLGRFTSVDPVQPGAPGTTGYNLYAYSGNNPTTLTDATGQSAFTEYVATVSRNAVVFAQVNTGRFLLWQAGLGAAGNCGLGLAEEGIEEALSYSSNNEYSVFAIAATAAYGCASGAADGIGPDDPAQAGRPRVDTPVPDSPPLYRGMRPTPDSYPRIEETAKGLGARPGTDIGPGDDGLVRPGTGGMSANSSIESIPDFRKPPEFGGDAKGIQMFCISQCDLGPDLSFRPDGTGTGHGFIEPAREMTIAEYQAALADTQHLWGIVEP